MRGEDYFVECLFADAADKQLLLGEDGAWGGGAFFSDAEEAAAAVQAAVLLVAFVELHVLVHLQLGFGSESADALVFELY